MPIRAFALPAFAAIILTLSSCADRWSAFVYPDKANLSDSRSLGDFESLAACRDASIAVLSRIPGGSERGTYECGKNCDTPSQPGAIRICAETAR